MPEGPLPSAPAEAHVHPRAVPWRHAFAWYEEAMRLWKRAWVRFAVLALVTIATELGLKTGPDALAVVAEVVTPLVACGMIYAAATVDRREVPSLLLAIAVFRAGPSAIAAVVIASAIILAAQVFAAWWIADVNLLFPDPATDPPPAGVIGAVIIGTLASLPLTFVPFLALLERVPLRTAFAASAIAFAQNTLPLLVYGAGSLVLVGFGLLTHLIGLLIALPLSTAAAYAAWKDVFGIREPPLWRQAV
jgi:hypothetical protein